MLYLSRLCVCFWLLAQWFYMLLNVQSPIGIGKPFAIMPQDKHAPMQLIPADQALHPAVKVALRFALVRARDALPI